MDIRSDNAKPGEVIAKALKTQLLHRFASNVISLRTSDSSQGPALSPQVLQQIQRASGKKSSRVTTGEDTCKGLNFGSREGINNAGSKVRLGQNSMPTLQCITEPPSSVKVARTGSCPAAVGGAKKRRRPSKKVPTSVVNAEQADFRKLVRTLTGGTFCSQGSATSSSILSSSPATEACVVQPQPAWLNLSDNGTMGDAPAGPSIAADTKAVSQEELSELPAFLFQGSEAGGYNDFMGYTNSSLWDVLGSTFMTTESLGVSSSSQFPAGVVP